MSCTDHFSRPISYLRVSITDRCNLRCTYCMPPEGVPWRSHEEILTFEEIERVVRVAAGLGIQKVRLTGGEPLVRAGVVDLVRMLAAVPGVDDLAMTTNGTLLSQHARALASAGLNRVNISLDTLRPDRFHRVTRLGDISTVLAGIDEALAANLTPVKLNVVLMAGENDDEIGDLVRLALQEPLHVRFIERMPIGDTGPQPSAMVATAEVKRRIEAEFGRLVPAHVGQGNGPATYYRLDGSPGTLGFISAMTEHFCAHCNRLRLTADGNLRPCLMSDAEISLRPPLRSGVSDDDLKALILEAVFAKPEAHGDAPEGKRKMSQIGG